MKILRVLVVTIVIISIFWMILTYWVERKGTPYKEVLLGLDGGSNAVLLYNPDPIYDFDHQICSEFARGLQSKGWNATTMTVAQSDHKL
jgi:hypothetical protein